jgi:hypothetical protein
MNSPARRQDLESQESSGLRLEGIVGHQSVEAELGHGREVEAVEGAAVRSAGTRVLLQGRLKQGARERAEPERLETAELRQLGAESAPLRLAVSAGQPGGFQLLSR